jgi:hypothetical protein
MPKYYVQSGQIKSIIDKSDHRSAILFILAKFYGKGLLTVEKICLSETGWSTNLECYDIDPFLREIKK